MNIPTQSPQLPQGQPRAGCERIGATELEAVLVRDPRVVEAVVTALALKSEGQTFCAFVRLKDGVAESRELKDELLARIHTTFASECTLQKIEFTPALPKSRSGKILRHVFDELAESQVEPAPLCS